MTRPWPCLTASAVGLMALSPWGQDAFCLAFLSGEQLSRNIWQPVYALFAALAVAAVVGEFLLRNLLRKRRQRRAG